MDSRRDFLKKAAVLMAGGGVAGVLPASIRKALAIDPERGSSYLDAEHVVILMQENRSFDHTYGTLRGVRGFNDPRAVTLPDGNPVWLQTNAAGATYAPFRLDIQNTNATWLGSLPHSWVDQVDARHEGKHDRWLDAKGSGHKDYTHLPLTLGYYSRQDLPFYHALADAFTVCDQNFCSSLTGTTPNRLYLWTGTIREQPATQSKANVRNEDVDYDAEAKWTTFPERLEDAGISWRVYQNEISLPSGLESEAEKWLANFTDNPLEWFTQYRVRFTAFRRHLLARKRALLAQSKPLEAQPQPWPALVKQQVQAIQAELERIQQELDSWSEANFAKLPARAQSLHRRAFTTNEGDPHYRELATLTYREGGRERRLQAPKGDVLHQFRRDVVTGQLPAVSWLVAPENFSDHPGAPWYGAWYVSEVLDILTRDPAVWRKTIFILCYDENDGYFDHVPPFVAPDPRRPETGRASAGLDTSVEQVRQEQETEFRRAHPDAAGRTGPIGLGYRVPLVVASPWSRGGWVCSQVFDHTSILQFLEKFLSGKTGRTIREANISAWRRAVCGDLTSVFRPYHGEKMDLPVSVARDAFLSSIHQAQFKPAPTNYKNLSRDEIARIRRDPAASPSLPQQEPGVRPSCALPYELAVDGTLSADRKSFTIHFAAGQERFRERAAGAPFHVYAPGKTRAAGKVTQAFESGRTWAYAVAAGERLADTWPLSDFADGVYHLRAHGPNGFFREFRGAADDPLLDVALEPAGAEPELAGVLLLRFTNRDPGQPLTLVVESLAYGGGPWTVKLGLAGANDGTALLRGEFGRSFGWHDLRLRVPGAPRFERRYAGRLESGRESFSDPLMGRVAAGG